MVNTYRETINSAVLLALTCHHFLSLGEEKDRQVFCFSSV